MGGRYLVLVAVLGAAVAVVPAIASSEPPTVSSVSSSGAYPYTWSPEQVSISGGGTVAFKNGTSGVPHGIIWESQVKPACNGVPETGDSSSWSGTCVFSQAGTYMFRCSVHPFMHGTITVAANGTTTTTTTTPTMPTPTTTTPTTPSSTPTPPTQSPRSALVGQPSLRSSQRGGSVKGVLEVSKAGAGDRLEIDVFAKSASLAAAKHSSRVRVGRLIRSSLSPGRVFFSVRLNARARRALRRHRRLALTVKITLTPAHGGPLTVTRNVLERA
jgi:plastocyanin